jgi:hypothetical protein
MAASGYTPILIYASGTATNVPLAANLTNGASGAELALNYADGKLYYKDSGGVVQLLASQAGATGTVSSVNVSGGTTGLTTSGGPVTTSGTITLAGTLITSNGGTGLTSFTAGDITYYASGTALSKLAIGTANTVLTSSGSAPQWSTSLTLSGSVTATTFIPSSSSAPTNGMYLPAANSVGIATNSTNAIYINSSQNVGIGTSSPSGRLHVESSAGNLPLYVNSTASSQNVRVRINSTDTASSVSYVWSYSDASLNKQASIYLTGAGALAVQVGQTAGAEPTTGTNAMFISSSGLVGVGTNSATSMLQTAGSSSLSAFKTPNIAEVDTISATAATGTINYDITTQSVLYYTSNASGNWTVNFRGSSGTSLNTLMQTGECISATFLVTQGSTAYYNSAVTIDGASVTPKWQGGTAPTSGNASSVDCYTYVIQKTGSATFTVLASQTKFA